MPYNLGDAGCASLDKALRRTMQRCGVGVYTVFFFERRPSTRGSKPPPVDGRYKPRLYSWTSAGSDGQQRRAAALTLRANPSCDGQQR